MMRNPFFVTLNSFCYQHKKTVSFIIAFFVLVLFGDSLLHLVGHFLHILLEVVESMLEHFLEAAFGFSARQAQVILFYGFVVVIVCLTWFAVRKAYMTALHFIALVQAYWQSSRAKTALKTMLVFGALGTTLYLFS
ncbi:hypothetical protein BCS42_14470 [Crenothrix sp. D3]|nr:hypothetical protein BCS42_14470 [Crenothrix sp. D3]